MKTVKIELSAPLPKNVWPLKEPIILTDFCENKIPPVMIQKTEKISTCALYRFFFEKKPLDRPDYSTLFV